MDGSLRVQLTEEGADAERLDAVLGYLRRDLTAFGVGEVTAVAAGPPPAGARAMDAAVIGGLLVSLGGSADSLRSVIAEIRAWLARGNQAPRSIRLADRCQRRVRASRLRSPASAVGGRRSAGRRARRPADR